MSCVANASADRQRRGSQGSANSVRRNRNWNEEAARKQLLQLFDVWGPKDESTIEGRKRLSSILFS